MYCSLFNGFEWFCSIGCTKWKWQHFSELQWHRRDANGFQFSLYTKCLMINLYNLNLFNFFLNYQILVIKTTYFFWNKTRFFNCMTFIKLIWAYANFTFFLFWPKWINRRHFTSCKMDGMWTWTSFSLYSCAIVMYNHPHAYT